MPARLTTRILGIGALLAFTASGACSEATAPTGTDPISNPSGLKSVGDLVLLNVNFDRVCDQPIYRPARVVAISNKALIYADTLNPRNGFSTADYQRFADRFDALVYPVDVQNFGEPTDIDRNGRIAIVFTRAVNELTAGKSATYTGGLAFSRDLFPIQGTDRAQACAGSNQGEYFYALTPDPSGAINGNVRTTSFVDSVITAVLAHELQHIINASRRLYVTRTAEFEDRWLDEALAHTAEELLFYRESGIAPRSNLDINGIRSPNSTRIAYNSHMSGNGTRYRTYLVAPSTNSPYALEDSVATRGAGWSFLRYAIDRLNATDGFTAGTGQTLTGAGDITLPATGAISEYSATVVNTALVSGSTTNFTLRVTSANGAVVPSGGAFAPAIPGVPQLGDGNAPVRDDAAESRRHAMERAVLAPMVASARDWYSSRRFPAPATQYRAAVDGALASVSSSAGTDAEALFKLVNNQSIGFANMQSVFGNDIAGMVRDWSVSHAADDIAALNTQYQQRSWNWHSIFPNITSSVTPYPLAVTTLPGSTTVNATVVAGGAAYYRLTLSATGSATFSLSAPAGAVNPNLQLVLVRTK